VYEDRLSRIATFVSLGCAINSLCNGLLLYWQFRAMKSLYDGFHWAKESERTRRSSLWNTSVLLSMPVVWLAWYASLTVQMKALAYRVCRSIISTVAIFLLFAWHADTSRAGSETSVAVSETPLTARAAISAPLAFGALNLFAALRTLCFNRASARPSFKAYLV
jgi:hypothetical protein